MNIYERNQEHPLKQMIEDSLEKYISNVNDVNSAWNIMRHVDKLQPKEYTDFIQTCLNRVEDQPRMMYLILRFAQKGLLQYKEA